VKDVPTPSSIEARTARGDATEDPLAAARGEEDDAQDPVPRRLGQRHEDRGEGCSPRPLLVFQMAEVAVPRELFRGILDRIAVAPVRRGAMLTAGPTRVRRPPDDRRVARSQKFLAKWP